MAKVITRAVFQMTPEGYVLLEEDSHNYDGDIALCKGGSAPVPDPAVQINAEKEANRFNINSPTGTTKWTRSGPGGYDTQDVTLSPEAQRQYDSSNRIAESLLSGGEKRIGGLANSDFSYDRSGFDNDKFSVDQSGYDKQPFSYNQATPDAAKASYARKAALLDPEFKKQDNAFEQRLANEGIPRGSEGYNEALRQHENNKNFALTDAAQQAEEFGTGLSLSERQQRTGEATDRASQSLAQRQQRQGEASTRANMGMSERQQRFNELAAALGGQQVMPVNAFGGGNSPNIDASGAYNNANNANLANYNAREQRRSDNTNAALTTAGTAAMLFAF